MSFTIAAVHFALALAVSSLGFKRVVYFVSLGYAFSISLQALVSAVSFFDVLTVGVGAQLLLLLLYGLRLGTYLVGREKNPAYQRELADAQQRGVGITRPTQVGIWLSVSLLYVLMFSPALANLTGTPSDVGTWVGVALMALGIGLEALADHQKDAFKTKRPDDYCDVGLYRYSRCPNYFGEVVFWVGNFVAGAAAYSSWGWWLSAATGLICIVLIMMGSTKRQEGKQLARYGARADFQAWVKSVPVLFPFVPVHTLQGVKVYLE